jgi:hypothetical protein
MSLVIFDEFSDRLPSIRKARLFSADKIAQLRQSIDGRVNFNDVLIGTFGSYARRELPLNPIWISLRSVGPQK